jgi:hypothetical protein
MSATLAAPTAPDLFWRRMRLVAFLSVVIGVGLELLLLAVVAAGSKMPDVAHAAAQVASKVAWSFVVCAGVSSGLALTSKRPRAMGLLGLVSGPLGFIVARAVHKSTLQALSDASPAADAVAPTIMALLRAVEYAAFGVWLGWIIGQSAAPFVRYLRAAIVIGIAFGAVFLWLFHRARPQAGMMDIVPKALNELLFPIGCACVLFVARRVSGAARPS